MSNLYKLKAWEQLRQFVLTRDGYSCQRCSVPLVPGRLKPNSAVVNHKVPHKGNRDLFFDPDNCEAVCKSCHDSLIQREEQGQTVYIFGEDGYPINTDR